MPKKLTTKEFIERSKKIHGDKYDYSKVEYLSIDKKVIIIMDNVEYLQTPNQHLIGRCPENTKTKKLTTEEFISKSKEIHGDKYDYSLVDFKNVRGKIKIIYNGLIYEQLGYLHLEGKAPRGTEDKISKGEYFISCFLINNNIKYINQHWYSDCRNILPLPFDFYLPDYNILIEYDGRQHFESVDLFGGQEGFERRKLNDEIKNKYCIKNGIPLLRISHLEDVDSKLNDFLIKHYI
jgi:hypothetical protein